MFNFDGVGWCQGVVMEQNEDEEQMDDEDIATTSSCTMSAMTLRRRTTSPFWTTSQTRMRHLGRGMRCGGSAQMIV